VDTATALGLIGGLTAGIGILWAAYAKLQHDRLADAKEYAAKCEAQVTLLREDVGSKNELLNKLADGFADLNVTLARMERALAARARQGR
jgi:hypothetical protein